MNREKDSGTQKRVDAFSKAMRTMDVSPERLLLKLMPAAEAAELLGKTENALRVMTHRREIPVVRNGRTVRYRLLDLLAWIEEHTCPVLS